MRVVGTLVAVAGALWLGAAQAQDAGVRERVAREYPHDRAIGYREGQIRGAISVKRPLD